MMTKNQDISKKIIRLAREFERGCMNTNVEFSVLGGESKEPWECEQCSEGFVYAVCKAIASEDSEKGKAIYEFITEP
jgi:hypothetical protein